MFRAVDSEVPVWSSGQLEPGVWVVFSTGVSSISLITEAGNQCYLLTVLAHTAVTKCHRPGGLKNIFLSFRVWEFKVIKVAADFLPCVGLCLSLQMATILLYAHLASSSCMHGEKSLSFFS